MEFFITIHEFNNFLLHRVVIVGYIEGSSSTTKSIVCLGENPIAWILNWQLCVVLSSKEVQYIAMSSIAKESIWLEMLGKDLKIDVPKSMILHYNNKVSMKMANNLQITLLNKHIWVHFSLHLRQNCTKRSQIKFYFHKWTSCKCIHQTSQATFILKI